MTMKLFYADCHMQEFTAQVLSCEENGGKYRVILDATAFYPEGGGQPADHGTLGDVNVLHVKEEGEEIVHFCDAPLPVGETVAGKIDWQRRFDLMQQHSGEHIISGILHALCGAENVGFHLGNDVITIDTDRDISPEILHKAETLANEAIWKNLPVNITVPSPEDLEKAVYRSKKALAWPVRLVEFPGCDTCACCGVHVAYTGEIGLIKILSSVRFKQGSRIQLVCGKRALTAMQAIFEQNRRVSQAFSAKIMETGAAAEKMNALLADEKYRTAGYRRQLFARIAESYRDMGDCAMIYEALSPAEVRELAEAMANVCGGIACVVSPGSGNAPFCLISHSGDVTEAGKQLLAHCGGHGGGKNGMMQGSLEKADDSVPAFFVEKMNFAL